MTSHEPESAQNDPVPAAQASTTARSASALTWVVTLTAGLAAGFGSWLLAEPIYGRYQPARGMLPSFPTPEQTIAMTRALRYADVLEASLTFGTLGALLGLTFGMAGGLARGAVRRGLAAAVIGLILGAACGLATGWLLPSVHFNLYNLVGDELVTAILVQGAVYAVLGALAGAAFSLGLGEEGRLLDFRLIAGGLLGAAVGLIVYQMAGGVAFPFDDTALPISSTWSTRLLAKAIVAGSAAIGVMLAMSANVRARQAERREC